jgi:hypothetical protein
VAIYEYHCETNGRTLEVRHGMSEKVSSWGELRARAGLEDDGTPDDAPVRRLMSAPVPLTGGSASDGPNGVPSCGPGCACAMD